MPKSEYELLQEKILIDAKAVFYRARALQKGNDPDCAVLQKFFCRQLGVELQQVAEKCFRDIQTPPLNILNLKIARADLENASRDYEITKNKILAGGTKAAQDIPENVVINNTADRTSSNKDELKVTAMELQNLRMVADPFEVVHHLDPTSQNAFIKIAQESKALVDSTRKSLLYFKQLPSDINQQLINARQKCDDLKPELVRVLKLELYKSVFLYNELSTTLMAQKTSEQNINSTGQREAALKANENISNYSKALQDFGLPSNEIQDLIKNAANDQKSREIEQNLNKENVRSGSGNRPNKNN
jgi:hypothetical protein